MTVVFRYRDVRQRKTRRTYVPLPTALQTLLPARYDEGDTFYSVLLSGGISATAHQQLFFSVLEGSMNHAVAIDPSDTQNLPCGSMWLSFVNSGAQTLTITTVGGETTLVVLPSGVYPIHAIKIWKTGTTVSNIVTYWT
jgi:hypothetical protein